MARRRMFSLDIVDTDAFLDMPSSAQNLYFHLGMRADDEGFIPNPKKVTVLVNSSADDFKLLVAKGYIIPFASGVCVVKDWKINNYIQADRRRETIHRSEKALLTMDTTAAYKLLDAPCIQTVPALDTTCIQNASGLDTQDSIGKDSIGKSMGGKPPRAKRFTPPTVEEVAAYCRERNNGIDPQHFVDYYTANGWMQSRGKPIKNWEATVRTWEINDTRLAPQSPRSTSRAADDEFVVHY